MSHGQRIPEHALCVENEYSNTFVFDTSIGICAAIPVMVITQCIPNLFLVSSLIVKCSRSYYYELTIVLKEMIVSRGSVVETCGVDKSTRSY